ncbi:MAG: LytR C-terminal domain-containing protein [Thermodesulfobacteriota bacterium]
MTIAASNDQKPTETPRQSAAPVPAPAAATPAEQPVAKKPQPAPEPVAAVQPAVRTEPQTSVAVSEAEKEKSPEATNNSPMAESTADAPPTVTALDLWETAIELKNGNGVQNCARDLRSRLDDEGFNVVSIGNHVDFGLEKTIIAYRSEAAPVARMLAQKFFPAAKLEAGGKTSPQVDIRVSLGHDLPVAQDSRYQPRQETAANEPSPQAPAAPEPTVPLKKAAQADPPSAPPTAATKAPEPATARAPHLMRVELRNGNGVPGQARKMRKVLRGEGFKVINIGNCKDYGLEETVIAYRPEAAGIAQTLSQKFFSGAHLKEKGDLPFWLDIRVLMGLDMIPDQEQLAKMTP